MVFSCMNAIVKILKTSVRLNWYDLQVSCILTGFSNKQFKIQITVHAWLKYCNTPATYQGYHTARIRRGRPLRLFFYLFTFEILPNFNLVREFWNETARVLPVITTFPKFTLWFLWYLYHYNQIQRELGGSSESHTRGWGLSLYKQLFTMIYISFVLLEPLHATSCTSQAQYYCRQSHHFMSQVRLAGATSGLRRNTDSFTHSSPFS